MIKCQIRLISEDVLLEIQKIEVTPNLGDEIIVEGEAYYVAAPPSEVIDDEAIVYVSKVT